LYKIFLKRSGERAEPDWRRVQLEFNAKAQKSCQVARLIPLVAMQRNGIRLQPAGKKIGLIVTSRAAMITARTSYPADRAHPVSVDK